MNLLRLLIDHTNDRCWRYETLIHRLLGRWGALRRRCNRYRSMIYRRNKGEVVSLASSVIDPVLRCISLTSALFKELELLKIQDLNKLETLKFIYNYENDNLPTSLLSNKIPKCNDIHQHQTRQQNNFHLKHFKTNIAENASPINRGLKKWNELDNSIIECSHSKFCNKVKSNILQRY